MTSSNQAGATAQLHDLSQNLGDRAVALLRVLIVLAIVVIAAFYGYRSIHWHMMLDSPVIRYVNFLISHGFRPYVNISDNNMPGAYYTDFLAMKVFGAGDLGWRMYEYFLLIVLAAALIVIAKPYDWLAGLLAAGLFLLFHAPEGPALAVEREEVIVVLLVVGYAAMFTSVRRQIPWLMGVMGVVCGVAVSIKPTFLPLPLALLLVTAFILQKRAVPWLSYVLWALAGIAAIAGVDLGYLLHFHAWQSFLFVMFKITPAYASLQRLSWVHLMGQVSKPDALLLLVLAAAAGFAHRKNRAAWTWEQWAIAMGVGFGLLSFFVQGKGFEHHRYTYLVLLFLLMSFELLSALRHRGLPRALAVLTIFIVVLGLIPVHMLQLAHQTRGDNEIPDAMQADLQELGGSNVLQDKVICFDMVYGCLDTLYRMRIVQNTGFTGDMLFFSKTGGTAVDYYRTMFWELERKDQATVLIISNHILLEHDSFDKLQRWPEFTRYLAQNYTLVVRRRFRPRGDAYRIYIRNGTPLLAKAESIPEVWSTRRGGQNKPSALD
jgi:hypothetical protein